MGKTNNRQTKFILHAEIGLIAVFLSFYLLLQLYGKFDFSLTDSSNVYLSQATQDGVAVSKRIHLFFVSIGTFLLVAPLFYGIFYRLTNSLNNLKTRLQTLVVLSSIGIVLCLSKVYGMEVETSISFVFLLFCLAFLSAVVSTILPKMRYLPTVLPFLFISAFLVLFAILILFNSSNLVQRNAVEIFGLLVISLVGIHVFIRSKSKISLRRFLHLLVPLTALPILFFSVLEALFYHYQRTGNLLPYKKVFIVLFLFLCATIWLALYFRQTRISSRKLIYYFFAPSALLAFSFLTLYVPAISQPTETFELANSANALLKIFEFDQIPFVDFLSSHVFSEQFYGIIYTCIHGFDGQLGFLTYAFFYVVLFYFLVYQFCTKLFGNPILGVSLILFFPYLHEFFHVDLFFSVLVLFALDSVWKKQSVKSYSWLLVCLIGLLFWRLDTGVAAIFATAIVFPISPIILRKKLQWEPFLKAILAVSLGILILSAIAVYLRSLDYLLQNLQNALHYASANQAHGYSKIATSIDQSFTNLHFLLPIIAVFGILYTIYTIRTSGQNMSRFQQFSNYAILFFFLIYLANFQRGLVRHSFMEEKDYYLNSTFYLAFTLLLLSGLHKKNVWRFSAFLLIGLLSILLLKHFPLQRSKTPFETVLTAPTISKLDDYLLPNNFNGKVIKNETFEQENYFELRRFLLSNLNPSETFYDFSNTPMLYFYTRRNVPSYFCQNLQNTVDDYLQIQQINQLKKDQIPVVVFANEPENWFDQTDGVPNTLRYYLLAEYIFQHYEPYSIIGKHSIWLRKNRKLRHTFPPIRLQADTNCILPKTHHYKHIARYIWPFIQKHPEAFQRLTTCFPIQSKESNGWKTVVFDIPSSLQRKKHLFAKIALKNCTFNRATLKVYNKEKCMATNTFTTIPTQKMYAVRLTNHYLWHHTHTKHVEISVPSNVDIEHVEFFQDER